ncbi:MAG: FMN phosphatase YigB (HAD superfamily) [Chitinophagales bacterium]|jgi:FMN phosphatase YigB (HAD superfamily)
MKEILKGIKNIIFDLGEVIVDLDISATEKAFAELLPLNNNPIYSYSSQTRVFDLLETGKISPQEFRNELRKLSSSDMTDEQIDIAWNAMLIEIPKRKINLVQNLRLSYQTFVLSNTNKIHIDYVNAKLLPPLALLDLSEVFDQVYYSHDIRERKPDDAAFTYVLNKHELNPTETLFIDDKLENIETAQKLGIKTWHLTNREDLYELL